MNTIKVHEVSDEMLIKFMKVYLEAPRRYHPNYLQILLDDYVRRVNVKMTYLDPESAESTFSVKCPYGTKVTP